jgi:hypothetical protein
MRYINTIIIIQLNSLFIYVLIQQPKTNSKISKGRDGIKKLHKETDKYKAALGCNNNNIRGSSVCVVTRLQAARSRDRGSVSDRVKKSLLHSIKPGTGAHGPTEPPARWVPDSFSLGVSGRCSKLTTHLHRMPRSSMFKRYTVPPLPYTFSLPLALLSSCCSDDLYNS